MNKLKRLLALLVCMAMTVAIIPGLTVNAEEAVEPGEPIETVTVNDHGCDYIYDLYEDHAVLTGYNGKPYSLVEIKDTIKGRPVTVIDEAVFQGCEDITHVVIPATITEICYGAFYGSSLIQVEFETGPSPENRELIIRRNAFRETPLRSVSLPEGLRCLEDDAFRSCESLSEIHLPDTLYRIGINAFDNTRLMTNWEERVAETETTYPKPSELYIDNHLITSNNVYQDHTVRKDDPDDNFEPAGECRIKAGTVSIADGAFQNCLNLTGVIFDGRALRSIGKDAFSWTSLKNILVPESVKFIGNGAFQCSSLVYACIPDSVKVVEPDNLFNRCDSLSYVKLPSGLKELGMYMFRDDISLREISIPENVETIGQNAFIGCEGLTDIIIPPSVKTIEKGAFTGTSLYSLIIPDTVKNLPTVYAVWGFDAMYDTHSLHYVCMPEDPDYVGKEFLSHFDQLRTVELGRNFGENPFGSDDDPRYSCTLVEKVSIPSGVEAIPDIFVPCKDTLRTIYFGGSMEEWDSVIFDGFKEEYPNVKVIPNKGRLLSECMDEINENIVINGKGIACGWFLVQDSNHAIAANKEITYTVDGVKERGTTSSRGLLCVPVIGVTADKDVTVNIEGKAEDGTVLEPQNKIMHIKVKDTEYSSSIEMGANVGGTIGIGANIGGSIGVAKLKGSIASLDAGANYSGTLSFTHNHANNKDGISITAKKKIDTSVATKFGLFGSAGILGATVEGSLADIHSGAGLGNVVGVTYTDDDFHLSNPDAKKNLAGFFLASILDENQTISKIIYDALEEKGYIPELTYSSETVANLSAGATIVGISSILINGEDIIDSMDFNLAAGDVDIVMKNRTEKSPDGLMQGYDYKMDSKGRIFGWEPETVEINSSNPKVQSVIDSLTHTKASYTQDVSIEINKDNAGLVKSIDVIRNDSDDIIFKGKEEYKGDTATVTGGYKTSANNQTTKKISFNGEAALNLIDTSEILSQMSDGILPFANQLEMNDANFDIWRSPDKADYTIENSSESGVGFNINLEAALGIKLGLNVGLEGSHSNKYEKENGVVFNGVSLPQSYADVDSVKLNFIELKDIIDMLMQEVKDVVCNAFKNETGTTGKNNKAIRNDRSSVFSKGDYHVSLCTPVKKMNSVKILTLSDENASAPSTSTTVGDGCILTVYNDDGSIIDEVNGESMSLTLEFTQDMLDEADINDAQSLKIFRWDEEKSAYVYTGGQLDADGTSLTAEVTKSGQYILATDNCPPTITNFNVSNNSKRPVINFSVSDLSGLSDFTFSIDDKTYVTYENLKDYYNYGTGAFVYPVKDELADGEHTVVIYAADSNGNVLDPPAEFTFDVNSSVPVINSVSPVPDTVTYMLDMSANVSGEKDTVILNVLAYDEYGAKSYISIPMDINGDDCNAQIIGIPSCRVMEIWVSAYNEYGNKAESEHQFTVSGPDDGKAEMIVTTKNDNIIEVHAANCDATDGVVVMATYDGQGQLLQTQTKPAAEIVDFDKPLTGTSVKVMYWKDKESMEPLARPAKFILLKDDATNGLKSNEAAEEVRLEAKETEVTQ